MSCERGVSTALRRATEQCRAGRELNAQEVADLVVVLAGAEASDEEKAEFLTAWAAKGETGGELASFCEVFFGEGEGGGGEWKVGRKRVGRLLWDRGRGKADREYFDGGGHGGGGGGITRG